MEPRPKKLLDQLRDAIRLKHYAYRTEETYVQWVRRYILFHNKRHPSQMGRVEIKAFLTHLAVQEQIAFYDEAGTLLPVPEFAKDFSLRVEGLFSWLRS